MTSPRHLWSGDWERDSAAAAEQLGRHRAPAGPPVDPEPEPVRRPRRRPARVARRRFAPAGPRVQVALVALVALVAAVAGFAIVSALSGSGGSAGGRPWLGVDLASSPVLTGGFQSGFGGFRFSEGAEVTGVVSGSPAAAAGIVPGDVITQVGQQPVNSPQGVLSAIAALRVGDHVELRYLQGAVGAQALGITTTQVTLEARPARDR